MPFLDLLENSLKNSTPSANDQKFIEEQFDKIVTWLEQEKINEAWALIEKCFAKGIPDIRLIVYCFYAQFFKQGIKSFLVIYPSITSLVNEHWEALKPLNRKEKQIESSLNWFFSLAVNKLKYCEKVHRSGKNHPLWERSVQETSVEELESLITCSNEFKNFFYEKWPKSSVKERVTHLNKKIEELSSFALMESKKIELEEEPQEEKEEVPPTEEVLEEETNEIEETEESTREERWDEDPEEDRYDDEETLDEPMKAEQEEEEIFTPSEDEPTVEEEPVATTEAKGEDLFSTVAVDHMGQLTQKLKVFEWLIEREEYMKAALVAKDINRLIETFDPLLYFPKMFSNYFSLLARHVSSISEQWDDKESLQLKYLEKVYQTDLKTFIDW